MQIVDHASLATGKAGMRSSSEDQHFDLRMFIFMSLPTGNTWLDLLTTKRTEFRPHLCTPPLHTRDDFSTAVEETANNKHEHNVQQQLNRLQRPYRKVQNFIKYIPTTEEVREDLLAFVLNTSFAVIHLGLSLRLRLGALVDRITNLDNRVPQIVPLRQEFVDFPTLQEPLQDIYTRYVDCHMHMLQTIKSSQKLTEIENLPFIQDSIGCFADLHQKYSKLQEVAKSSISWLHKQDTVNPQFNVMGALGEGTFSKVRRVQERSTGQWYAMKTIEIGSGASQLSTEDTVKNEINIMRKLRHHHITTLAFSTKDSQHFNLYILPVADGDLGTYLKAPVRYGHAPEKIYKWFGCLIGALEYAHKNDIKHKDIKPSNILLNRNGDEILITDFGLARDYSESGISRTMGPLIAGTPKYLAPECIPNGERTEAVDIFALGCVFAEILYALTGGTTQDFDKQRREWGGEPFRDCRKSVKEWLYEQEGQDPTPPTQQIFSATRGMLLRFARERSKADFVRTQLNHDKLRCAICPR